MQLKEFLHQYQKLGKSITALRHRLDELRSYSVDSKSLLNSIGGGKRRASYTEVITEKIAAAEENILLEIDRQLDTMDVISSMIDSLDDPLQRAIMQYKYLSGMSWERVCENLFISLRTCHNIHNKALVKLSYVLNNKKAA